MGFLGVDDAHAVLTREFEQLPAGRDDALQRAHVVAEHGAETVGLEAVALDVDQDDGGLGGGEGVGVEAGGGYCFAHVLLASRINKLTWAATTGQPPWLACDVRTQVWLWRPMRVRRPFSSKAGRTNLVIAVAKSRP